MQKEFLHCELFRYDAVGIAVPLHSFHLALQTHGLDVRLEDCLVAYHPHHLVYDAPFVGGSVVAVFLVSTGFAGICRVGGCHIVVGRGCQIAACRTVCHEQHSCECKGEECLL